MTLQTAEFTLNINLQPKSSSTKEFDLKVRANVASEKDKSSLLEIVKLMKQAI